MADLKGKSVRGGVVTMISQAVTIAIQLTSTVVLARLLSPDDYGVLAMVLAVTGFAGLFRDLGLSSAAIQKKDLTHAQQSNLFWLNVGMGILLTVLVAAASPVIAWFYGRPELAEVTLVLSISFMIGSFGTQHGAILVRNMQFRRQTASGVGGAFVGLVVSVILALNGFSYWSLVWGNICGGLVTTVLLISCSPFRPSLIQKGTGIRNMLKFGLDITAFNFVNYFQRNLDNILIGKLWGPESLGVYSRAYSLLMLPITTITGPLNAVAFPAMSKLQSHPEELKAYYLKTTSLIALMSMPMAAFLFVSSRPIIEISLGQQWEAAAGIFTWLSITAFIQPTLGFAGSLVMSLGLTRRYLFCGIGMSAFISMCFLVGVQWGPIGVAISYAIGTYLALYPLLRIAFSGTQIRFEDFLKSCSFPIVLSLAGGGASFLAMHFFKMGGALSQLIVASMSFALGVVIPFIFTNAGRTTVETLRGLARQIRGKMG